MLKATLPLSIVVFLFLSGCASLHSSEMLAIGCTSLDIATTAYGLENGFSETNPIYEDMETVQFVVSSVALSAGFHYLLRWATKKSNANWWYTFGPYGGMRCAFGAYNIGVILDE